MSPLEFFREFTYPLRNASTLVTIAVLALLMLLADAAGLFGIWLYVIVAICSVRYATVLLEARARADDPEPPGIEMFSLVGSGWTLFPVVHLALGYGLVLFGSAVLGGGGAFALGAAYAMVLPALFAALAITRSPLESLNLGTAFRLIGRIGLGYWAAPAALLLAALLPALIPDLPRPVALVLDLGIGFGVVAVIGGMIRPFDFFADVDIETPVGADPETTRERLATARTAALNHAYGFASRGNVDGALRHISQWIAKEEPYPGDAWPWFFTAMLKWEDPYPALRLAQDYLDLLLAAGETGAAVKLMLRCRYVDENFRPHAASREAALTAAESLGHEELVDWLRRR